MNRRTWIGLFLALGASPLLGWLLGGARQAGGTAPLVSMLIGDWALALALLAWVRWGERLPLTSIGLRRLRWSDLTWSVGGFLIGVVTFMISTPLVAALGLESTAVGIQRLAQAPLGLRWVIVLTAGITEEILFRGYPIERLSALTGRLSLAAVLTWAVFTLLHLPFWGLGGALQIGLWSVVIVWLYVRRHSLGACMGMHILNDAYAFILLPMWLPQYLK